MKLQVKMTLTLLVVSLITAGCVGIVAYSYLMLDFRQLSQDQAFENFTSDIIAYIDQYGSLENGRRLEPFTSFVSRRKLQRGRMAGDKPPSRELPLFKFMILDPDGLVIAGTDNYSGGQKVSENILAKSKPIEHKGKIVLRVVQIGDAVLTEQDRRYLQINRKALMIGFLAAGMLSVLLGLTIGKRQSSALRELSRAIIAMSLDGEIRQDVPVRSKDEIGLLARAFNRMSESLTRTHSELRESHDRIQTQARELKELSIRDPLTNLFNRRHFDAQVDVLFNQSLRYNRPFTVMIGDLDHFKKINDRISHRVGDDVLKQVADLLLTNTRKSDIAARYGGEEFVIAFPESTLQQAQMLSEKLRDLIESHPWENIHPGLKVTISMGVCADLSLGSVEKMLNAADERLYEAKSRGRNRIIPAVSVV